MAQNSSSDVPNTAPKGCDMCGACCRTFPILVSIGDGQREPRIAQEACSVEPWNRNEEWEYKLHPLPFTRGCLFLDEGNRCSIYDTRPRVCRVVEPGGEQCVEARARVGLAPL